LGDDWTHRCVVDTAKVDPLEVLGIRPQVPLPFWGWGTIPDQYGRRVDDDDGGGPIPPRPQEAHPMLTHQWPDVRANEPLDIGEVRQAIAARDVDTFLAAITSRDLDDALHEIGAGVVMALAEGRKAAESIALGIHTRLRFRGGPGDEVLAEDILLRLQGEEPPGQLLSIDLDELSSVIEGDEFGKGGYLDLQTGEVWPASMIDAGMVGDDAALDIDEEPDRWLRLDAVGSRADWLDMAAFAERQRDEPLRSQLERAIEGRGAFRRFRDLVFDEGLLDQWRLFSSDRRLGRARQMLAAEGIRVE